jgi:hypothetical protein
MIHLRRAVVDCCLSVAVYLITIGRSDDGDDTNYSSWHGELDTLFSFFLRMFGRA